MGEEKSVLYLSMQLIFIQCRHSRRQLERKRKFQFMQVSPFDGKDIYGLRRLRQGTTAC